MSEGTPPRPGDEPERPPPSPTGPSGEGSRPTEPFGQGSRPTEPFGGREPQAQGGPPPPYGTPPGQYGYGYQPAPQTESTATAALVIAIVGFFLCPPVAGIVALLMANSAERKIKASGGRLGGLDQARIAKVIAIIELALVGLAVVLVGLIIALASGSNTSSYLGLASAVALAGLWTGTARTG